MRRWYEPRNDRPDLPKDAPRKKGMLRFAETLWRELFNLIKLNLLFLISCIPIITIPAALTAMSRVTVTMSKDENSFIWNDYWKAFRLDFWKSLLAGVIFLAAFCTFAISTWFYYQLGLDKRFFVILAGMAACMLLCAYMASMYFFPMIAMVELPMKKLLLNSLIMVFLNIKYSIPALILSLLLLVVGLGMMPYSLPFVLLLQFSLMSLVTSFLIYPGLAQRVVIEDGASAPELPPEEPLSSAEIGEFPDFDEE